MKQFLHQPQEEIDLSVAQPKAYRDRFPEHHFNPVPEAMAQRSLHANLHAIQRTVHQQTTQPKPIIQRLRLPDTVETPSSVATEETPVIQRLTELSSKMNISWKFLKNAVADYNTSTKVGLFQNIKTLEYIYRKAGDWLNTKDAKSEVEKLRGEVSVELGALLKGGRCFLSEAAQEANSKFGIMKKIQFENLQRFLQSNGVSLFREGTKIPKMEAVQECYILKAMAAGCTASATLDFAKNISSLKGPSLYHYLNLTPDRGGITQQYADFCASTTVVILKAHFDPTYAFEIRKNNKDLAERMDQGKMHDPEWLKKALASPSYDKKPKNNYQLLFQQYTVAKTYSTDKTGRMGLNAIARTKAFNEIAEMTGLQYETVSISGEVIVKTGMNKNPDIGVMPKQPEKRRLKDIVFLLETPLLQGAPVGVGVGGHAEIFVGIKDDSVLLYEPSQGQIKPVSLENIAKGMAGSDTIVNLILPKLGGKYTKAVERLSFMGDAANEIQDFTRFDEETIQQEMKGIADEMAMMYGWAGSTYKDYLKSTECRERAMARLERTKKPTPSYIS